MSGKALQRTRPNPLAPRQRASRRQEQLGEGAVCANCGYSRLPGLRRVPHLCEEHHTLGRQHDPKRTIVLCANCHALYSAGQLDDGVDLHAAATELERIIAMLGAQGSFFRELGEGLLDLSRQSTGIIRGLDQDYPGWREKPWAHRPLK